MVQSAKCQYVEGSFDIFICSLYVIALLATLSKIICAHLCKGRKTSFDKASLDVIYLLLILCVDRLMGVVKLELLGGPALH